MNDDQPSAMGRFDIAAIAASLPDSADTMLVDRYLTDRPSASARVFRVYKPTPPHYHAQCDEFLYVFSGRGTFCILEEPLVFVSIDTPRRDPKDVIFVDPADGTPESFIRQSGY